MAVTFLIDKDPVLRYDAQTLTEEPKAQARANIGAIRETNCKIIAHRGYFANAPENTIQAFKDAITNGFRWMEIDIRRCADGVYVLSHDDAITLYNSGVAVSVSLMSANYADIKDYTWDSEGVYKINTLLGAFNASKLYDMRFVCDIKSGANKDILLLAASAGVSDKIMLTYYSLDDALVDAPMLNRHGEIGLRIIPDDYEKTQELMVTVKNPMYANLNAQNPHRYQECLPIALACGLPIIYAGCNQSNAKYWQVVSAGCMAESENTSYAEFAELLDINYENSCNITATDSVSVVNGSSANLSAVSDVNSPEGYIYGYSMNPNIAQVKQIGFGTSAVFTITGRTNGSTVVRLFTGCGNTHDVTVNVSETGDNPNDGNVWVTGYQYYATHNPSGVLENSMRATYLSLIANSDHFLGETNANSLRGYYPVMLNGANKVTLYAPYGYDFYVCELAVASDGHWSNTAKSDWIPANNTYVIKGETTTAVVINLKNDILGTIVSVPEEVCIEFSHGNSTDPMWINGHQFNASLILVDNSNLRATYMCQAGEHPVSEKYYPIPLNDSTSILLEAESGYQFYVSELKFVDGAWNVLSKSGWLNPGAYNVKDTTAEAVAINLKNDTIGNIGGIVIPDVASVVFQ